MELKRGQVVRSLAGHDKGTFQTILCLKPPYAIVCDGKRRSLEKPKKKKLIHLAPTKSVLAEEILVTDKQIRRALKTLEDKLT